MSLAREVGGNGIRDEGVLAGTAEDDAVGGIVSDQAEGQLNWVMQGGGWAACHCQW